MSTLLLGYLSIYRSCMDMQTASSQSTPITMDAKLGALYKLWVVNILLNIITLGIYSFWGKTRVRRYVVSCFKLVDDRFEFTGTGKEIFLAFLKALIFLILISIPLFLAVYDTLKVQEEQSELIAKMEEVKEQMQALEAKEQVTEAEVQHYQALKKEEKEISNLVFQHVLSDHMPAFIVIMLYYFFYLLYLPFVAKFGVMHYLTGHLRWRGIRGDLQGSAFLYGLYAVLHTLLVILTLGLWLPVAQVKLMKYKQNRLYFGSQKGEYVSGQLGSLFLSHILTLLLFIPTLSLSRFWYRARLARMHMSCFRLNGLLFESTITGWGLLKLKLLNFLILIFTLGIGYPIVLKRNVRFFAKNILIIGNIQAFETEQAQGTPPKTGTGISHWLDVGANFKSGYMVLNF